MGWILLAGAVFLAATRSGWWWLIVIPLGLWRFFQWQIYSSRPWRRIHFPMMRLYARAAGLESGLAEREGRDFDVLRALATLIEGAEGCARPYALVQVMTDLAGLTDEDEDRIAKSLSRPGADSQHVAAAVQELRDHYRRSDNAIKVRLVIAGSIGRRLGSDHRVEYLLGAAKGKAP